MYLTPRLHRYRGGVTPDLRFLPLSSTSNFDPFAQVWSVRTRGILSKPFSHAIMTFEPLKLRPALAAFDYHSLKRPQRSHRIRVRRASDDAENDYRDGKESRR